MPLSLVDFYNCSFPQNSVMPMSPEVKVKRSDVVDIIPISLGTQVNPGQFCALIIPLNPKLDMVFNSLTSLR